MKQSVEEPTEDDIAGVTYSKAGCYKLFQFMLYTQIKHVYDVAKAKFKEVFADQVDIVAYFEKEIFPYEAFWTSHITTLKLAFGQRTTSAKESGHRDLKTHLVSGQSTVYQLYEAITKMLDGEDRRFRIKVAKEAGRLRRRYRGPSANWLGDLNKQISRRIVDLMNNEKLKAEKSLKPDAENFSLGSCCAGDCNFTAHYGAPCRHAIVKKLQAWTREKANKIQGLKDWRVPISEKTFTRADVHRFHWLERDLAAEDRHLRIGEFTTATRTKGRPRGKGPFNDTESIASPVFAPASSSTTASATPPVTYTGRILSDFEQAAVNDQDDDELPLPASSRSVVSRASRSRGRGGRGSGRGSNNSRGRGGLTATPREKAGTKRKQGAMAGGSRKAQKMAANGSEPAQNYDLPPLSSAPALLETSGALCRKSTRSRKPSAHAQEAISMENLISSDDILGITLDGADEVDDEGDLDDVYEQQEEVEDDLGDDSGDESDTIVVATH